MNRVRNLPGLNAFEKGMEKWNNANIVYTYAILEDNVELVNYIITYKKHTKIDMGVVVQYNGSAASDGLENYTTDSTEINLRVCFMTASFWGSINIIKYILKNHMSNMIKEHGLEHIIKMIRNIKILRSNIYNEFDYPRPHKAIYIYVYSSKY